MATSTSKFSNFQSEILSYKPDRALPRGDERVLPDRLVIGVIDAHTVPKRGSIASALRRAVNGDVERRATNANDSDRRETSRSTEGQEEMVTGYISVIERKYPGNHFVEEVEKDVIELAAKVGFFVVLMDWQYREDGRKTISKVKEITGSYPVIGLWSFFDERAKNERKSMSEQGCTEVYDISYRNQDEFLSDTEQLQLLSFLRECLRKGDEVLENNSKQLTTNPVHRFLYEKAKKEAAEARCETTEEMRRREQIEVSLQQEMEMLKRELEESANRQKEKEEEVARLKKEKLLVESSMKYMKNQLKSEKEHVEQLERETWKLRTKIQLESEMRSAETSQWMVSGKQTQPGTSLSEDPSSRGSRGSDALEAGKELPEDEFADILEKIAKGLHDEAMIDSLGGQLGIIQGDIERAIRTSMKFVRISSEGTRDMLQQWRRGVSREEERIELRRALKAAKLTDLSNCVFPQEESTGSEHPRQAEDPHQLSGENGNASKQGSSEELPKHSADDKQYAPEDIMPSGGESEDSAV